MALLSPQEIQFQVLHRNDDRSSALYTTAGIMAALPAAAVIVRLACRRHLKVPIAADDIAIVVSLVLCWALCVMLVLCAHYGSGRHTILAGVAKLEHFLQIEYAFELTYAVLITVIKVSILLFYRRIFPVHSTSARFRTAWWIILVWCILWSISVFFSAAFQCSPASYYWTKVTTKTHGTCLNITALLISTAILNVVTDVAILILPMPIVWRLQISKPRKFATSGIFLLGGFVCVASIVRACYLSQVVPQDPLWTNLNGGIWSAIEPGVGIIAACLPTMGPILRKTFSVHSVRQSVKTFTTTLRFSKRTNRSNPEKNPSFDSTSSMRGSGRNNSSVRKTSPTRSNAYRSDGNIVSSKPVTTVSMIDLPQVPMLPHSGQLQPSKTNVL